MHALSADWVQSGCGKITGAMGANATVRTHDTVVSGMNPSHLRYCRKINRDGKTRNTTSIPHGHRRHAGDILVPLSQTIEKSYRTVRRRT